MKSLKIIVSVLVLAISFAACQSVDFKKASNGIPYKIFSSKKGDSVRPGSVVKYQVMVKAGDSVTYSSYTSRRPEYFQVKPQTEKPTYSNIRATAEEIMAKSKEGDSIYLVQSADSLMKANPMQTNLKKGERIVTTIRVEKVYKTEEEANADILKEQSLAYEQNKKEGLAGFKKDTASQASIQRDDKIIEDYLKAHNIQAEKNEWGYYMERLTPGQGPKPKYGQYVSVKYKGTHLSGEVFDQGTIPVQIGFAQVVFGFHEAVSQLSKGEKVRVYLPSLMAYGPQGNPPKIKPNEILIFELEALDITDTAPQQQQQPVQQPSNNKKQK